MTTRAPGRGPAAPSPAASTVPANSCPMVWGGRMRGLPLWKDLMSVPQMAQASTRTSSSPRPGTGGSDIRSMTTSLGAR